MKDRRWTVIRIERQFADGWMLMEEAFSAEVSEGAGHRKSAVKVETADYIAVVIQKLNCEISSDAADAVPQESVRSLAGLQANVDLRIHTVSGSVTDHAFATN